jgi:CDGSH-type Zn-finger protein/uncharacterized Fe-S cluster protein YjdI
MANAPSSIIIDTREDLLYLLGEASEIEHNLMCCYLYAAWSLKTEEDSGLSAAEHEATKRWKRAIIAVAVEEMSHVALASNLMVAIGGAPHLGRPNFPVPSGYHPSGVVVELARFDADTLDHFIFLERPEGDAAEDSPSFPHTDAGYQRFKRARSLMPSSQHYETVGELYRAIRQGFDAVAKVVGETNLFCGGTARQLSPQDASLPGLSTVHDLASAHKAIETIIEQGEGAPEHSETGHYARFLKVREEFRTLKAANPAFDPAYPCARNPVMRKPANAQNRVYITEPAAAATLDLANALYGVMLRCLSQSYGRSSTTGDHKRMMIDGGIDAMYALTAAGEYLATLPASPDHPGLNAGVTFTMLRDVGRLPEGPSELRFMEERLFQISARAAELYPKGHRLSGLADQIKTIATKYKPETARPKEDHMSVRTTSNEVETAEGKDITVHFSAKRCIHARFCVLGAPTVFKANTPGEWIFPDTMQTDKLIAIAEMCPSGAITYERKDGKPNEAPPPVNLLRIRENGPLAVHAPMTLNGEAIENRATLCRCGASKNKPFCDGSHTEAKFSASGEPTTQPSEPLATRGGTLDIKPMPNGPLAMTGNLEICSGTGRTVNRVTSARLCRCGGSANKPYCDGSHTRIGFSAD